MLSVLRSHRNSPVILFLLGAIIIVFIAFFGNQWSSCAEGSLYAAKVNGHTITDQEYSAVYANEFRNRQNQDPKYDRARAQRENLRENVLNRLITSVLLADEAKARGLAVDDEALRKAILENPSFQTNGHFDRNLYERILNSQGLSDYRFENQLREGLLAAKIASLAENAVSVSDAEAREQYERERRRVNVEFVQIKKDAYLSKVGAIDPAQADEYLKKENAEEELKKYYAKHSRAKYNVPKQVCAQHILVRTDSGLPPDQLAQARTKISDARKAVVGGMDFAEAAKKFSDDATKDRGGDLGCFSTGQVAPPVEQAAFALKPGEISGVVESPFGLHVIKVTGVKEPIERKLEDVKKEIALEILAAEKAGELAQARAAAIAAKAATAPNLQAALDAAKDSDPEPLKVLETGPFAQRDFVPRLGLAKEVSAAAWQLTADKPVPPAPIGTEAGWVVIRLKERTEPDMAEFEKEKKLTMLSMSYQKRSEVIRAWTEQLRKNADVTIHPLALSYDDEARANARGPQR